MDLGGFIGRFHPLFVHLPIGLLLLAGIFEYFARKPKYNILHKAIEITLFIGALSAIFASISGWLLANRGAYIERSLFLHRWIGIAVAVFATLCWLIKTKRLNISTGIFKILLIAMTFGVFGAGHFGGQMTHGDDYLLEYAPSFLKNILSEKEEETIAEDFGNPESVKIYDQLLAPVFENKCWKCHHPDNALGGLDMTTKTAFLKGGTNGEVLENGEAYQSEIFKRITLPSTDRKSMPPVGLALSFNKTKLIEWWINTGASFEKTLGELELSADVKNLLAEEYGISFIKKSALEKIEVAPANPSDISQVKDAGFNIKNISEDNHLLDVEIQTKGEVLSSNQLDLLLKIKNQITWLALPDSKITDAQMEQISQFQNLTRLRLQNNPITDIGVQKIENLPILESLNLVGTAISDEAIFPIQKMISLKSLYIFQTKITDEAIESLISTQPELEVVKAFQFRKPEE